jgi:hypothetical protein
MLLCYSRHTIECLSSQTLLRRRPPLLLPTGGALSLLLPSCCEHFADVVAVTICCCPRSADMAVATATARQRPQSSVSAATAAAAAAAADADMHARSVPSVRGSAVQAVCCWPNFLKCYPLAVFLHCGGGISHSLPPDKNPDGLASREPERHHAILRGLASMLGCENKRGPLKSGRTVIQHSLQAGQAAVCLPQLGVRARHVVQRSILLRLARAAARSRMRPSRLGAKGMDSGA